MSAARHSAEGFTDMRVKQALDQALQIVTVDGEVVFLGDGAVNFSMTPSAARQTLRNLADALGPDAKAVVIILLVEDEPLIRELSVTVLEDAGFHVIAAEDAMQALKMLESGLDPKVLFTDVHMPGDIDGLQLAHAVRERRPRIEVLVSSGASFPTPDELPARGRFLRKPYTLEEMVRHVGELAHG
jgi:CheY-like chemotaxis protein